MKKSLFGEEARAALMRGIDEVANAVKPTLGPAARTVVLERQFSSPIVINDGVTIAQDINLDDPYENLGVRLIQEAATKTQDNAGDGTTTASIMTQALCKNGINEMKEGRNPIFIKQGFDKAVEIAVEHIKSQSQDVTDDWLFNVATIAANNDEDIGSLIAKAFTEVGHNGIVSIDESNGTKTELEIVDGLEFAKGVLSPHFIPDGSQEVVLENPLILVTNEILNSAQEIVDVLNYSVEVKKPILIIASKVEGEALATLALNKSRGVLDVVAVEAPTFGDSREEIMTDITTVVGAVPVFTSKGMTTQRNGIESLGGAKKVVVTHKKTTIIGGRGLKNEIKERQESLIEQSAEADTAWEKEALKARAGKLSGGVAVLHIGGKTEAEMKERVARVDDSLNATRAALEEGIVVGGSLMYLWARDEIMDASHGEEGDVLIGMGMVQDALCEPFLQLCYNCGMDGVKSLDRIFHENEPTFGLNARTMEFGDLMEQGVIDPAKVVINSLQTAASIAGLVLTTEVLVAEV